MTKKIHDVEMQFLTVGFAKGLGLNAQGLVETFDYKVYTRDALKLRPILLYSVVAPAYAMRFRKICDAKQPISISAFLREAWGSGVQEGKPLRIEVKPSLMSADKGFVQWVHDVGVQCTAASSLKSINAHENKSQDLLFVVSLVNRDRIGNYSHDPISIDDMNRGLLKHDRHSFEYFQYSNYSMDTHTFEEWNQREKHFVDAEPLDNDWDAKTVNDPVRKLPNAALATESPDEYPELVPGLKDFIEMWPCGRNTFLKRLNVSAKDMDFWFASRANLPDGVFFRIVCEMDLDYNMDIDEYEMHQGSLLVANKVRSAHAAYDAITRSDIELSFEVLAPNESSQLPMRVFLYRGYGTRLNMMLFDRGAPAAKLLDNGDFSTAHKAVRASAKIWEELTKIVENHTEFVDPVVEVNEFEDKHERWLMERSKLAGIGGYSLQNHK